MTTRIDNYVLYPGHVFHDILDAAGIAPGPDVVGRVREVVRRLEAVTLDRDSLVGKLEEVRGERDKAREDRNAHSLTIHRCHAALTGAHVQQGDLTDRVKALIWRDECSAGKARSLANITENCHVTLDRVGVAGGRGDLHGRVKDLAARAPKVAAVEWARQELRVNGGPVAAVHSSLDRAGQWFVYRPENPKCWAASKESAMRLAELLAGHDPGGVWRIGKDIVSPDTVRMVCPSVAVTWGES